jgi:hypothetical protein
MTLATIVLFAVGSVSQMVYVDPPETPWPDAAAVARHEAACAGPPSIACAAAQGIELLAALRALDRLTSARDPSAAEEGLAALDIDDSLLRMHALNYLGRIFPLLGEEQKAKAADAALALTASASSWKVQESASRFLRGTNSPYREYGDAWLHQHDLWREALGEAFSPWLPPPEPALPAGLKRVPDGERFGPFESDRSASWTTSLGEAEAAAFYEAALQKKAEDGALLATWMRERADAYLPKPDPQALAAMQGKDPEFNEIMQEIRAANGDMEKLKLAIDHQRQYQAKLEARAKAAPKPEKHPGVIALQLPRFPSGKFIVDERERRAARLVLVVPAPQPKRTLVIVAWDPKFFPVGN